MISAHLQSTHKYSTGWERCWKAVWLPELGRKGRKEMKGRNRTKERRWKQTSFWLSTSLFCLFLTVGDLRADCPCPCVLSSLTLPSPICWHLLTGRKLPEMWKMSFFFGGRNLVVEYSLPKWVCVCAHMRVHYCDREGGGAMVVLAGGICRDSTFRFWEDLCQDKKEYFYDKQLCLKG